MPAPNISFASTAKIESINIDDEFSELIDIEVEGEHTFWISDNDQSWTLTHNSGSPDIDCVDARHLVVMHDGSLKRAGDIVVGDQVTSGSGRPCAVTATYKRRKNVDESLLCVVVRANDGTLGNVHVVPNHKFIKSDGSIVRAHEIVVGDALMASTDVTVVSLVRSDDDDATFVDVTVEDDHTFKIVPFDVVVLDDEVNLTMGYIDEIG